MVLGATEQTALAPEFPFADTYRMHQDRRVPFWTERVWLAPLIAGLLLIVAVSAWWARRYELEPSRAPRPFRIAYHSLPPEQGVGTDLVGAANEIFQEACRRRHVPVELVEIDEEPLEALREGKLDLLPVLFDTPENRETFHVSDPWYMDSAWMASLNSSGITSADQVAGKRVWYQNNPRHTFLAYENFPGARLEKQTSFTTAVEGVCLGQADAALVSPVQPGIKAFFENLPACRSARLRFSPLPRGRIWFGVGALRSNAAASRAADAVRNEIGRMAQDGTLGRTYLRWGLDPNNAATVIQYLTILRQRGSYMMVTVVVLMVALLLLSWQTWRLRKARQLADQANAAKTEFLANMSHEIRTPLNGIIGMTRLAFDAEVGSDQRELLGIASASADALLSVVDEILDFAKLEAGKLRMEDLEIDLYELVETSTKAFALAAHEKDLELVCDISPECPAYFVGDPVRLRQVLFNLLSNAVKFTAAGEIRLAVDCNIAADGEQLHFMVADTGIGIAPDKHATVFEPFSQADTSTTRRFGGTGLGLSISRQLVELMDGRIWLESEESHGARFHFVIPLRASGRAAAPIENFNDQWAGKRVLIVDDNASARAVLERILLRRGLEVTCVATGKNALTELARARSTDTPYALLLLDSEMPDMDGFAVAELAQQRFGLGRAIIMMLTSDQCSETAARCLELGIVVHLLKPVRRTELLSAVRQVLRAELPRSTQRLQPRSGVVHESGDSLQWRVLLAEDNAVNRKVGVAMLQRAGHHVVVADNGKHAVELVREQSFDLILMDIQMPEMDGVEATQAIRRLEAATGAHVPIVAMTAHALEGDNERFLAAGMDAYIAKPFQPRDLFEVLRSVMGSRQPAYWQNSAHGETPTQEARSLPSRSGSAELLFRKQASDEGAYVSGC
jgi:signal transduction histidine kinase/DNA-binding response OmpR family regulator